MKVRFGGGQARELDRVGNYFTDETADFGRRRVGPVVLDARPNLSGVCDRWYPVVLSLHRVFIAISRALVNHVDAAGNAPDPLVWSAGGISKRRRLVHAVRDRAFLPVPPRIWDSEWFALRAVVVTPEDVASWPCSVGILVTWVTFLGTLHWLVGGADLGAGGVSHVELLILHELWAGGRLVLDKALPRYRRFGRTTSVLAVPFGPGMDVWRSCRFVPCGIGAKHCRLRHTGCERCGHGLTSSS